MHYLPNILFVIALAFGIGFFVRNVKRLKASIFQAKPLEVNDHKSERLKQMFRIAIGQSKMVNKPIAGLLHIVVYVGFIIINIEVLEIVLDGVLGTHRIFAPLGTFYNVLIASFEILAVGVILSVLIFWIRRNIIRINRFIKSEMTGWPKLDANLILYIELVLMSLFLIMNAADLSLQQIGAEHYQLAGSFPVASLFLPLFESFSVDQLIFIERTAWWLHILGILAFLNYLYYSKHLHILLAFPNTYYGKLTPKGQLSNDSQVASEVAQMMDPSFDPYAAPAADAPIPEPFGASDVDELNWVQLMNAYSCTECGRCTASCPANLTGKKLSPRHIMMKVRDRAHEKSTLKRQGATDTKKLLGDYITPEELWACTSCNACVEACPISIDPLSIIIDMRRYLVMEQSAAPTELNSMMTNVETNGAPWPFNQLDRANWTNE